MQTAAGVAAGALAFEGIESLMHGFGHAAGYGGSDLGGFGGGAPREEVVNNYYGDSDDANDRGQDGRSDFDTSAENGSLSPDVEDRRDLTDSGNDDPQNDSDNAPGFNDSGNGDNADTGNFDSGSDDTGGGFNDGGGFDGGGDDSNFS